MLTDSTESVRESETQLEWLRMALADQAETRRHRATVDHLFTTLQCPECLLLFAKPVTLTCGHTFCLMCAWTVTSRTYRCPVCRPRKYATEYNKPDTVNFVVSALIDRLLPMLSDDNRNDYERRRDRLNREERHRDREERRRGHRHCFRSSSAK
jgi:hypothetical protein